MVQNIFSKLAAVKTFVFDMDGVLTDGGLLILSNDAWRRTMNVKDGYALQLAVKHGYNVLVVSGSSAPEAGDRMNRLGVSNVFFNVKDKKDFLAHFFSEHAIDRSSALFMGDDMPDKDAMQWCGLCACPADAAREIFTFANYISPFKGGAGCVRDVIEKVLRLNGQWTTEPKIAST